MRRPCESSSFNQISFGSRVGEFDVFRRPAFGGIAVVLSRSARRVARRGAYVPSVAERIAQVRVHGHAEGNETSQEVSENHKVRPSEK